MAWLRSILDRFVPGARNETARLNESLTVLKLDDGATVSKVDLDKLNEQEQIAFRRMANEFTGIPQFNGRVIHGWDAAKLKDTRRCPRCKAETRVHNANFIYATQLATRVMFAPAGAFCTACPTVIVDQDLIEVGIADPRHKFMGMLGVDYCGEREPDLFESWNGRKVVLVLDEEDQFVGVGTMGTAHAHNRSQAAANRPSRKKHSQKKREKAARRARRAKK